MLQRAGPFDLDSLIKALLSYLPYNGGDLLSYDVEYMDSDRGEIMVANFIWVNNQWVYVDSRTR